MRARAPRTARQRPEAAGGAWARTLPARLAREAILGAGLDPIVRAYAVREEVGRDRLAGLGGPLVLAANHCSHVDTPVLLRALPGPLRRRTAVVAAADYFYANPLLAAMVSLAFCTVPIERRRGGGTAPLSGLLRSGWSVVMFAEGTRSRDGRVGRLRTGAAALAIENDVPLVPVHIAGTHAAMPVGSHWMTRPPQGRRARHAIRVSFGPPIHAGPGDDRLELTEQVRLFMHGCGAETAADPRLAVRRERAGAQPQAGEDERPTSQPRTAGGRSA